MLFGSTNPTYSLTGTCSRAPPVDLWGPDDERSSRPVLREREGETPSRHSPKPHVRIERGMGNQDRTAAPAPPTTNDECGGNLEEHLPFFEGSGWRLWRPIAPYKCSSSPT